MTDGETISAWMRSNGSAFSFKLPTHIPRDQREQASAVACDVGFSALRAENTATNLPIPVPIAQRVGLSIARQDNLAAV